MTDYKSYLAIFFMDKNGAKYKEWFVVTDQEREQRAQDGVEAVKKWEIENKDNIVFVGGPLGPTLRLEDSEIKTTINEMTVFIVVNAPSHEAAITLLTNHPHLTHFPCHAVEVMPILG